MKSGAKSPSFRNLHSTSLTCSKVMRSNRAIGTKPEQMLRSWLWSLGLRYRKNVASLPGKPDVVFVSARMVVFCDGDFWHGHDWSKLRRKLSSGRNSNYWVVKIRSNMIRDKANIDVLEQRGWKVIRVWESEIRSKPEKIARKIKRIVDTRQCRLLNG